MSTLSNSKVHVILLQGIPNQSPASILGYLPPFVTLAPGDLTPLVSMEAETGCAIIGRNSFPIDLKV